MKSLLKLVPWLAVAVFGMEIVAVLLPKPEGQFHVHQFASLPVLLNGRIQPFDSVARNSLLQIRSTSSVPLEEVPSWKFWHHPEKLKATTWLLEVMTKAEEADTRPIFLIHHAEILGELKLQGKGLEKSGLHYYTFNDLKPVLAEISDQGRKASEVKSEVQTPFQRQMLKLANAVLLYQRLKFTLQPEGIPDFPQLLAEFQQNLGPARAAAQAAEEKGAKPEEQALGRISGPLKLFQEMAQYGYPLIVPPLTPQTAHDHWLNAGASLLETGHSGEIHPAVVQYAAMAKAYAKDNPAEFNQALDAYGAWLVPKFEKAVSKGHAEFYYNSVNAFLHAMIIYIFAFVLALVAILTFSVSPNFSESLRRAAFYLVILAGVVHTFGLVFRMVLEGRPPVTNLYSSAIFIGWGAMVLGIIIERIYRAGVGSLVASLAGFVTLMIAHNLALGGDTMEMLRAVLDTNFWLATHVVVVTLGYASTFFAGLLAIIYIFLGLFTPLLKQQLGAAGAPAVATGSRAAPGNRSPKARSKTPSAPGGVELGKALTKMVYGIVCFATLFSFVGTVLGGIWADQSWGRFWGWDPKENGALLIVLWNAIILHARWGGLVRERGLMNLAVFGNVVTSFSWFGVNMLGIGLHAYGFMDAAFKWLLMFVVLQLLIIGDGLLPRICWESLEPGRRGFGTTVRWLALALNVVVMLIGLLAGYNSATCIAAVAVFFAFVLMSSLASSNLGAASPPASSPSGAKALPLPLPPNSRICVWLDTRERFWKTLPVKQSLVTLDMEGVLTPEIWIAVAEKTGIQELRRTTRDEPDYDKLMRSRLKILDEHGLKLSQIQEVIGTLRPLEGAGEFLDNLRAQVQVIILSDTFEQFASPLLQHLGRPTLLCHRLHVEKDQIVDYCLRVPEQKQRAVAAFKLLNYHVISAGDSFNDTAMLTEAHIGLLFRAPHNVKSQFPQFEAVESYADLARLIRQAIAAVD